MKKQAFTLAEITLVLSILGILAVVMIKNIKSDAFKDKELKAGAVKVVNDFNIASMKIREIEHEKCPNAVFMVKAGDDWEYTLTEDTSDKVLDLYSEYLKLDKPQGGYFNFCDYTKGLQDNECASDASTNISAVRLAGDIYVGLKMNVTSTGTIGNCPASYYRINTSAKDETPGVHNQNQLVNTNNQKCWAKLYIDVNGKTGPNVLGEDIFIYGMDENGVLY